MGGSGRWTPTLALWLGLSPGGSWLCVGTVLVVLTWGTCPLHGGGRDQDELRIRCTTESFLALSTGGSAVKRPRRGL